MGIITIDDRNPLLSYLPPGAWGQEGVSTEYNGTTSSTTSVAINPGSTVTLTFSGTGVDVYGTIGPLSDWVLPPQPSYVIDNGSATYFTGLLTNEVQYHQLFFNSGTLSASIHTLIITLVSENSTFFLDYIQLIPLAASAPSAASSSTLSSSSSVASTSSSFSPSMSTQTQYPLSYSTATASSTSSSPSSEESGVLATPSKKAGSSTHMSAVIGVSLGVLALLIVVFFTILLARKYRREMKARKMLNPHQVITESLWTRHTPPRTNPSITPFIQDALVNDNIHLDRLDSYYAGEKGRPFTPVSARGSFAVGSSSGASLNSQTVINPGAINFPPPKYED